MGQSSATSTIAPTTIFKTGSLYGPDNLAVSGSINGHACYLTIDTGSNISVVRPDMLQGQDPRSIQPVSSCLRTVTGETAPIRGKGKVKLKIGSAEMTQDIWIADIQDECILGLDFLEPQGCMVNLREGTLLIGEEEITLEKSADTQAGKCCRAVLEASAQIPPCSEIVVTAKVRGLGSSARWGILETQPGGGSLLRDGLLVGRKGVTPASDLRELPGTCNSKKGAV